VSLHYPVKQETQKFSLFYLNAVRCFVNRHTEHLTVKPPFAVKTIDCLRQIGLTGREMERLGMSLTCSTITMSIAVSVAVSKMEWKLTDSIAGISYYLKQILDAIKRDSDDNFIFQQCSALMFLAFNTVQLLQCKTPIFLSFRAMAPNGPELNSEDD